MTPPTANPRQEWVWILTCSQCFKTVDFNNVSVPTQPLARWAKCCGQIMELETVSRLAEAENVTA